MIKNFPMTKNLKKLQSAEFRGVEKISYKKIYHTYKLFNFKNLVKSGTS